MATVHICDYVAGNIQSLVNAVERVGHTVELVRAPADILQAKVKSLPQYN